MKRIVIISCYPAGQKEKDILIQCIEGFRNMDCSIMIVSHLPLDNYIAQKAEFVIYDSNNTFLSPAYTPPFWMQSGDYVVNIFNSGHALPICRSMRSGINLAKAMGYEEFIFTECDVLLSEHDADLLVTMLEIMDSSNKKMLFFKPEEYRDCGSYVYETLLFAGKIDYFLSVLQPPLDEEEWLLKPMGNSLELSFFEHFSKDENDFLIIHDHSSNTFINGSEINVLRYGLFNSEIVFNEFCNDEPVLFIINSLVKPELRIIDIYKNGEIIESVTLKNGNFWVKSFDINNTEISIEVYNEEKTYLHFTKTFILNQQNLSEFKKKGVIKHK